MTSKQQADFVAAETYEDGCQKTTWRNFHENGHQHVCVCGLSVTHPKEVMSRVHLSNMWGAGVEQPHMSGSTDMTAGPTPAEQQAREIVEAHSGRQIYIPKGDGLVRAIAAALDRRYNIGFDTAMDAATKEVDAAYKYAYEAGRRAGLREGLMLASGECYTVERDLSAREGASEIWRSGAEQGAVECGDAIRALAAPPEGKGEKK